MFVGMLRFHLMLCVAVNIMAVSTLESEAAFRDRAQQIGVEGGYIEKFVSKIFSAFGRYAFCVVYSPHHTDEAPMRRFLTDLLEEEPEANQMVILSRLFFEAHTMTLTDARQRVEALPDPAMATRRMATAERVARQREQQANTELKLRSTWQRRNLAMDLAGLATFSVMEGWTQLLFSHLLREQPRGLDKVSLQ